MSKMIFSKAGRLIWSFLPPRRKKEYTKQFFFLHIPKTAGTSLRNIVESQFSPRQINKQYGMKGITKMEQEEFDCCDLIRGHFTYNLVDKFREFPYVITMLREPVARTISHIKHVINDENFWLHKYIPVEKMSVGELLENEKMEKFIRDHQLRLIACDCDLVNIKTPKILHLPHIMDEVMLEKGKERLKKCDYVGIAEQFDESIKLLCKTFNWPEVKQIRRLNTSQKKKDDNRFTPEVINRIRELCKYDIELYNFAVELFNKRLSK